MAMLMLSNAMPGFMAKEMQHASQKPLSNTLNPPLTLNILLYTPHEHPEMVLGCQDN